MATEIIMPKLGSTMIEGTLVKWLKNDGDRVAKGEPIASVMSKKVTFEVTAAADGILRVAAQPGAVIPVGQVLGYIMKSDAETVPVVPTAPEMAAGQGLEGGPQALEASVTVTAVPAARKRARELGVDLVAVKGSGPAGRITVADVEEAFEASRIKATPVARRLAREFDLDLRQVPGSGPGGRVTEEDVRRAVEQKQPPAPAVPVVPAAGEVPTVGAEAGGDTALRVRERIPFIGMRRAIADNMTQSLRDMAQVSGMYEADVSGLVEMRRRLKDRLDLTYTDIIIKMVALALRQNPFLNAIVAGDEILLLEDINIGVAVAIEGGLIVPVVHHADTLSLSEIAAATKRMAEGARQGNLSLDDVSGGTFTVTNPGMFGADGFTPIINPPEVAILGTGRIVDRPVVVEGEVVVRPMMTLSLTFDHRVMDGAPGARFINTLKEYLANPYLLLD